MLSHPQRIWGFAAGSVVALMLGGWWWWGSAPTDPIQTASEKPPQPIPLSDHLAPVIRAKSPYLNTRADAASYVGNASCMKCHEEEYQSYQRTGHSRALLRTRPLDEPPDAEFYHAASRRWYKVYREAEQLRHREFIRDDQHRELVLSDYAVTWTIGSGQFSKSYLVEDGGFLVESPVTWYANQPHWGMSPGFDLPAHPGFERLADQGCLVCHAGQVAATDDNGFRPRVIHSTIGCESCHGPGSLHVARYQSPIVDNEGADFTIVNPARLEASLSESICANCHLRGEATVLRRGLQLNDYRPGLPLTDVRLDYGTETPQNQMEVVGHMEQMWLSRCYKESKTLTCITCHDPHHQPEPADRVAGYRHICLKCHGEEACGLPKPTRLERSAQDDCVSCHMPKTGTDIPHFAFTHHRIAKPKTKPVASGSPEDSEPSVLIPLADHSHFSQAELDRNLGLAYLEYAEKQPEHYKNHLYHAGHLLEKGEPDSDCLAALARVYFEANLPAALDMAEEALRASSRSSSSRLNALVVRGTHRLKTGQFQLAQEDFQQLTRLKRHAGYWHLLAGAYQGQNKLPEAMEALERAVHIAPDRVDLRKMLIDLYLKSGQPEKADSQQHAIDVLTAPRKESS